MGEPGLPADDLLFADLVVRQGLCSREKVDECMETLRRLRAAGAPNVPPLGELLVRRGLLSAAQADATVRPTPATSAPPPDAASPTPGVAARAAANPANRVGKYIRVARLGEGGMGEVWKAWDTQLGRWVALKFLKGQDASELARFRREAQTAARLSHPNIAAVYEAQPSFIAMQLVDGQSLATFPRRDRRALAEIVRDTALAVHYANEQGIVHRDLKPANIMVEHKSQRVYVMDFGLARQLEVKSALSRSGMMIGTPAYMPPEQAQGHVNAADARSDVYSLGATLYELLTDRPPFQDETAYDLLLRVVTEDPKRVRRINPRVEPDLETITMKCLEKIPGRRYATARDLADDLTRWLQGEPIVAHPPSTLYRLRKFVARRRALVGAAGLGSAAVVALAVLGPLLFKARGEREQAERALRLWGDISNGFAEAELAAREGDVTRARRIMEEGVKVCRAHLERAESAHARYFLGRLLRRQGRRAEAEQELTRALALRPTLGEAHFERGLLRVEEYGDRYGAFRLAEAGRGGGEPTTEEAERSRPELRDLRNRAIEDLKVEVGESSYFRKADALYGRAELARLMLDHDGAERQLSAVLDLDPSHVDALVSRTALEIARGRPDAAIEWAGRAISKHAAAATAYRLRATALSVKCSAAPYAPSRAEWLSQWLRDAEQSITIDDGDDGWHACGLAHAELGELDDALGRDPADHYARAIEALTRAIERAPGLAYPYVSRGDVHRLRGDAESSRGGDPRQSYARAVEDYAQALERHANDARAYSGRGNVRLRLADLEPSEGAYLQAIDDFSRAIREDPGLADACNGRGAARMRLGDLQAARAGDPREVYARALEDLERALSIPNVADVYNNRGNVHFKIGEAEARQGRDPCPHFARAIEEFGRAIDTRPGYADAFDNRSGAHIRLGEALEARGEDAAPSYRRAIEDATRALEFNPGSAHAYHGRANAHIKAGQLEARSARDPRNSYARALEDYTRAIERNPRYGEAYAGRGFAHLLLGDAGAARSDWTQALKLAPGLEGALRPWIEKYRR